MRRKGSELARKRGRNEGGNEEEEGKRGDGGGKFSRGFPGILCPFALGIRPLPSL